MPRHKPLTADELRHRATTLLPHGHDTYEAAPDDPRWSPLEDLALWHGTIEEVRQWVERDATEAQTLFDQVLGTMEQAGPSDLNPALRDTLRCMLFQLMAKYRMQSAIYLESLRPPAVSGEASLITAQVSGLKSGDTRREGVLERNATLRTAARQHPAWGKNHSQVARYLVKNCPEAKGLSVGRLRKIIRS